MRSHEDEELDVEKEEPDGYFPWELQSWSVQIAPIDKILFHYTSFEAAASIIDNKTIWASEISYLNDESEFRYALDLIVSRLNEHPERDLLQPTLRLLERLDKLSGFRPYVASFSEDGDSLSQWRGYCTKGSGVSLGFDGSFLIQQIREFSDKNYSRKSVITRCIYDEQDQIKQIDGVIEQFARAFKADNSNSLNKYFSFAVTLSELAPTIKNRAFKEEAEWRIIATIWPAEEATVPVKYRPVKSLLIPYVEIGLPLTDLAIPVVFVAPNPHRDLSCESVRRFLNAKLGTKSDVVRLSTIPYRDW
jgi:hypothetical protein